MGGVKDGGCGHAVWEGQGWRVWPCSVGGSGMERMGVTVKGVAMQCGKNNWDYNSYMCYECE